MAPCLRRGTASNSKTNGFPPLSFHQPAPICDEMFKGGLRRVVAALSVGTMVSAPPPFNPGAFVGNEHHFRASVYFEDTALSGIVQHSNYLRHMDPHPSAKMRIAANVPRPGVEA